MSKTTSLALFLAVLGSVACRADQNQNANRPNHLSRKAYPGAVVSVTDPATGIQVTVAPDGEALMAVDRTGKTLWKVNPVQQWGKPRVGASVIRHLSIQGDQVQVTIGKHHLGEVDLKTGRARPVGSD